MGDQPPRASADRGGAPVPPGRAADLPLLLDEQESRPGEAPQLQLGDVAGTGRMAVVREATQLPLRRRVAVKIPHFDGDADALVAEARIAGALEHPNIVPIHVLGRDREGRPRLVMKLIEGEPWSHQLAEPDRLERLRHHLGILLSVCNAVGLAHGRGVIHRDLKPANVMIGPFGEVYVVDWGLAIETGGATRPRDVEGTPAFMAPEMLSSEGAPLGPACDIHLLGGILHVILAGVAPYEGMTLRQRLADPTVAPVSRMPHEVAPELIAICQRALSTGPSERHTSVHAFREAIEKSLRHLGSLEVSTAAEARLRSLREADADDAAARELIIEARFGFQQALHAWPGNDQARRGLQATLELACAREIERRDADAAVVLLAALPKPNEELTERVTRLRDDLAARHDKLRVLEELEQSVDLSVDAPARLQAATAAGGVALGGLTLFVAGRAGGLSLGYGTAIVLVLGTLAAANAIARLWFRRTNVANRRAYRAAAVGLLGAAFVLALGWWGGLPLATTGIVAIIMLAMVLMTTAASLGLRLEPAALSTYTLAAVLTFAETSRSWITVLGAAAVLAATRWGLSREIERAQTDEPSATRVPDVAIRPCTDLEPRSTPLPPEPRLTADDVATWRNEPAALDPEDMATRRAADERGTIALPASLGDAVARRELPRLVVASDGGDDEVRQLQLGPEAGSGGMGTVYQAIQLPLGRRVAVKIPNDGAEAAATLFREALVAGVIDHPNVVPIHMLGRDEDDRPLLVMKYVEGTPWLLELCLPDRLARLDHHLDVLMQVCHAIGYAHHRGVLHRDLKATNVMVGAFGEVQVLDWGLAVAISDEHAGRLPMARDLCEVEGTPSYMAPEMITVDTDAIGPATDVYLLGALLHYVLVGRPPHHGSSLTERIVDPYSPVTVHAPDAPAELVAICVRALHSDPAQRFPSTAALRRAIADYRQHQSSSALVTKAAERAEVLAQVLDGPRDATTAAVAHELTTEARFGFRQALRAWPANPEARAGLQRVLELSCDFALERGAHGQALSLLAALPEPRPALARRVEQLGRALEERSERVRDLEELERGVDLAVHKRSRAWGSIVLGLVTVGSVGALTIARILGIHEPGYLDAIVVVTLTAIANGYVQRTRQDTNDINVRIHRVLETSLFSAVCHLCAGWVLGVDFTSGLALMTASLAVAAMLASVTISWLVAPATLTLLPTALALMTWPAFRPAILIVGFAATFGALALSARSVRGEDAMKSATRR